MGTRKLTISFFLGACLLLVSGKAISDSEVAYEYKYTGATFTAFSPADETNPFYPDGYITGSFTVEEPLPPNSTIELANFDWNPRYRFGGVGGTTLTNANSGLWDLEIATDSDGIPSGYHITITGRVESLDDPVDMIEIDFGLNEFDWGHVLEDGGCYSVSLLGICTSVGFSNTLGLVGQSFVPGSWEVTEVPGMTDMEKLVDFLESINEEYGYLSDEQLGGLAMKLLKAEVKFNSDVGADKSEQACRQFESFINQIDKFVPKFIPVPIAYTLLWQAVQIWDEEECELKN